MKQNFDVLKLHFEDYSEEKLRGLTGEKSVDYLDHYVKRLQTLDVSVDGARVLEIGCGEGKVTRAIARLFSKARFTAVDLSEKNIHIAQSKYSANNIDYQMANIADKSWKLDGCYDVIFSFSLIQYFDYHSYQILQEKLVNALNCGGGGGIAYEYS